MDNRTRNSDLWRLINKPSRLSKKASDAPKQSLPVKRTISEDCTGAPDVNCPHKYHCLQKEAQRHGTAHLDQMIGRGRLRRSRDIPIPPAHNAQQADQKMVPASSTFKPKQCKWKGCTSQHLFMRENDLVRHLRTIHVAPASSTFKPKQCKWEGCTSQHLFMRENDLVRHLRTIHIAPHAYPCLDCSSTFGRKDHLQMHRKIRHGY